MAKVQARLPEAFDDLTGSLISIGFGLAGPEPSISANIEDALFFASVEALEHEDGRVLLLLLSWLDVHSARINADRLVRLLLAFAPEASPRFRAFWRAFAEWKRTDRRFHRLLDMYKGPRLDLSSGTAFHVSRHGEDPRFEGTCLRVPGNLRNRPGDVLTPEELARKHVAYRWRTIIGPTYRADMWALLETREPMSVRELARRSYGSLQSAWAVKRDFAIIATSSVRSPDPTTPAKTEVP